MATESVNYQCPACGGPLRFDGASRKLACDYCGSSFEVAEVEALYGAKQAAADQKAQAASVAQPVSVDVGEGLAAYTCSSCGAELVCEPTTVMTECPYCGNPAVAPGRVEGVFAPDLVIPFKLDKEAAKKALKRHYEGKYLLPKSFSSKNRIDKVQGVYVPFWLFDAQVQGVAEYEGRKVQTRPARSKEEQPQRIVDHYYVLRGGTMGFTRMPVDGSTKMPDGHMDAIEPFNYAELTPFSMAYLPGYAADRYDQTSEECKPRAEGRMRKSMESELRGTVRGYNEVSDRGSSVQVGWTNAAFAMLPVWMLSTTWNGQNYLFAMNGQTGKLVGDLPVDKGKLAVTAVIAFLVSAVLTVAVMLGLDMAPDLADCVVPALVVGALATLVTCLVLTGSMKSARKASQAAAYATAGGLRLTQQQDRFTGRTIE